MGRSSQIDNAEIIMGELINKSFPILKDIKIKIIEAKRGRYSAFVRKNWGGYLLIINRKYIGIYNNKELKGLLAHELSHVGGWVKKGVWVYLIDGLKYGFSKSYKERYEKETDKKAICKGYRKELKAFREKRWSIKDKNFKKIKRFYLSPKEIENYKIG